ncbi:hypothetical protein M8J77_020788 [Diaphorina citri]|nr:hypothetical protein M8J77_020788 [Diaphorina citri]
MEKLEWDRFRNMIVVHQKLLLLQQQVHQLFRIVLSPGLLFNNLSLCSCLFQLAVSTHSTSLLYQIKIVGYFLGVIGQYYYLCYCSEMLNSSNVKLRRALESSLWYNPPLRTRRNLSFLLRRLQRPNYITLYHGTFVLSQAFLLNVLKISYNFVNCMKLTSYNSFEDATV